MPAGTVLFRQGDAGDCAYVVEEGRIAISLQDAAQSRRVAMRGRGEIFGEMAIVDGSTRSATATAIEDSRLLVVTADRLSHRLAAADPVLRMVVDVLAGRLRATMAQLARTERAAASDAPVPAIGAETGTGEHSAMADIRLEQDLVKGIARGELCLHFQPIVELAERRVLGFESLARWNHPERGLLPPADFIPRAESSGLVTAITRWALPHALDGLLRLTEAASAPQVYVTVNVSVADLQDPDFPGFIACCLADRPDAEGRLKIEVTESLMLAQPDRVRDSLQRCREMGVDVAIDDFGTGYSSLSHLHRLPIGALKIDRNFIAAFDHGENGRKIVRTILRLAEDLAIPTIAEGVETEEQAALLAEMGCGQGQGYLFARPMSLEAAGRWLRDRSGGRRAVA